MFVCGCVGVGGKVLCVCVGGGGGAGNKIVFRRGGGQGQQLKEV